MVAGLVSNSNNRYWPRGVPSSFDFMAAIKVSALRIMFFARSYKVSLLSYREKNIWQ